MALCQCVRCVFSQHSFIGRAGWRLCPLSEKPCSQMPCSLFTTPLHHEQLFPWRCRLLFSFHVSVCWPCLHLPLIKRALSERKPLARELFLNFSEEKPEPARQTEEAAQKPQKHLFNLKAHRDASEGIQPTIVVTITIKKQQQKISVESFPNI